MKDSYRTNRRSEPRVGCRLHGRIYVDGCPAVPCEIADLSANGAQLRLTCDGVLPGKFLIYILSLREVRAAKICWRRDAQVGIEFVAGEADLPLTRRETSVDIACGDFTRLSDVVRGMKVQDA